MDMEALDLSRTLGQGFPVVLQNGLQKDLRETLESISEITVALDITNEEAGMHQVFPISLRQGL
jgi:hypothetical protein